MGSKKLWQWTKSIMAFVCAAVIMIGGTVYIQAAEERFEDIRGHFSYASILALDEINALDAFIKPEEIFFYPGAAITRAEFISVLFEVKGVDFENGYEPPPFGDFTQIPDAFKPYVAYGYQTGVITGKEQDGVLYFGWQDTITRQEAAVFICRAMGFSSNEKTSFEDDGQIAEWAKGSVAYLNQAEIIQGYPDGTFLPHNQITRGEAVVMLYKVYNLAPKVEAPVTVEIFAGTGLLGYGNGARQRTGFITPQGLAVDAAGILYVTDADSHLVSRIYEDNIMIVAGAVKESNQYGIPTGGFMDSLNRFDIRMNNPGQAVPDLNGAIYVTDRENHVVRKINTLSGQSIIVAGSTAAGYVNGGSLEARFNSPFGIALDENGNKYIADTLNHCIRVIDNTGQVSLLAGNPETPGYQDGLGERAMFCEPTAIAYDRGVLYVADSGNSMVRKIQVQNGLVSTVAGVPTAVSDERMAGGYLDGPVDKALFKNPKGICVGADGQIYVADTENHVIRKINVTQGVVTTLAGAGTPGNVIGDSSQAEFNKPMGLAIYDGKLYIADSLNGLIKRMDIE